MTENFLLAIITAFFGSSILYLVWKVKDIQIEYKENNMLQTTRLSLKEAISENWEEITRGLLLAIPQGAMFLYGLYLLNNIGSIAERFHSTVFTHFTMSLVFLVGVMFFTAPLMYLVGKAAVSNSKILLAMGVVFLYTDLVPQNEMDIINFAMLNPGAAIAMTVGFLGAIFFYKSLLAPNYLQLQAISETMGRSLTAGSLHQNISATILPWDAKQSVREFLALKEEDPISIHGVGKYANVYVNKIPLFKAEFFQRRDGSVYFEIVKDWRSPSNEPKENL